MTERAPRMPNEHPHAEDPMDGEVFAFIDATWEEQRPATRHPVPARYAPDLTAGDLVSVGEPGRFWLDDQVVHVATPARREIDGLEADCLLITTPASYYVRSASSAPIAAWWPLTQVWVYRDATTVDGQPAPAPLTSTTWLDFVADDLAAPPVRRPRPARDALPLTGRTVRVQSQVGTWTWWVAVSEPYQRDGAIVVNALIHDDYEHLRFRQRVEPQPVAIHRMFVYA